MIKQITFLISILGFLRMGISQISVEWKSGVRINFENDRFAPFNSDRNYTQGVGVSSFNSCISERIVRGKLLQTKAKNKDDKIALPFESLVQLAAFTPDELRDSLPILGDRPYSTVIWLGGKFSTLNIKTMIYKSVGLNVGMLGIYGPAKFIQTSIHKKSNQGNTIPPYNPAGWHNQISNGGEPTAMFSMMWTKLLAKDELKDEIRTKDKEGLFQSSLIYGFNIGYLTQLSGGISIRFGKLRLANFAHDPFNVLSGISQFHFAKEDSPCDGNMKSESFLFASIIGNVSVYNASLHGQVGKSVYRLPYGETGFVNAQARVGAAVNVHRINVALYVAFKTPEIWNSYARMHYWGGASLTCLLNKEGRKSKGKND